MGIFMVLDDGSNGRPFFEQILSIVEFVIPTMGKLKLKRPASIFILIL